MCEVIVACSNHFLMSLYPRCTSKKKAARAKKHQNRRLSENQEDTKMSREYFSLDIPSDQGPPVPLDTHPLRGLRKPLCTSTPDLAKVETNSSSDSLNYEQSHHNSHEDVRRRTANYSRQTVHSMDPSSRYEWNEAFLPEAKTRARKSQVKRRPVSAGYSKLRILDEPKAITMPSQYSVITVDAVESPSKDTDTGASSNVDHHYFTLEVLDDHHPSTGIQKGADTSSETQEDLEESEGVYFTTEDVKKAQGDHENGQQPTGIYSYVELDTDDRGTSPPVIVIHSRDKQRTAMAKAASNGATEDNTYDSLRHNASNKDNTYDSLRRNYAKKTSRSISQPSYDRLLRNSPSPKPGLYSSLGKPGTSHQKISPPSVPFHKRDCKRGQTYHGTTEYESLQFKYPDVKGKGFMRTYSPKTPPAVSVPPVTHDYDEVEIIDDGDTDESSDIVLTDDDVPIHLPSPTPPHTPVLASVQEQEVVSGQQQPPAEQERSLSSLSSHSNMVQLIITEEGPKLMPRKRSLTADASSLRRFRNQQKLINLSQPRATSATGNN